MSGSADGETCCAARHRNCRRVCWCVAVPVLWVAQVIEHALGKSDFEPSVEPTKCKDARIMDTSATALMESSVLPRLGVEELRQVNVTAQDYRRLARARPLSWDF